MIDKYLRAANEPAAIAALSPIGMYANGWETGNDRWALDPIGLVYAPTGQTVVLSDGSTIPEMAAVPGFHLNIRIIDETLSNAVDATGLVIADPVSPYRVWA